MHRFSRRALLTTLISLGAWREHANDNRRDAVTLPDFATCMTLSRCRSPWLDVKYLSNDCATYFGFTRSIRLPKFGFSPHLANQIRST